MVAEHAFAIYGGMRRDLGLDCLTPSLLRSDPYPKLKTSRCSTALATHRFLFCNPLTSANSRTSLFGTSMIICRSRSSLHRSCGCRGSRSSSNIWMSMMTTPTQATPTTMTTSSPKRPRTERKSIRQDYDDHTSDCLKAGCHLHYCRRTWPAPPHEQLPRDHTPTWPAGLR